MSVRPILTPPTAVTADPTAGGQGVQCGGYGTRGCAASHSRARRWASTGHSASDWMCSPVGEGGERRGGSNIVYRRSAIDVAALMVDTCYD